MSPVTGADKEAAMNLVRLTLGNYQTNCYLVWAEGSASCAVIDPGYDPERILEKVRSLGLTLDAVLLTHGHFDHVGGVEAIVKATGCALWMQERDWHTPTGRLYPLSSRQFTEVNFCKDLEEIRAGGLTFTVYETPGHTQGSVCYACEDALFSGDTLFAGACGRIDLPGGSRREMRQSLKRLSALERDFHVFPGHGEPTGLAHEKQNNPYMKGII